MALINARDPAHDLSTKLSPCTCSHSSCTGWRNACDTLAISQFGIVTNLAVCNEKLQIIYMLLAQARPMIINHLTGIVMPNF